MKELAKKIEDEESKESEEELKEKLYKVFVGLNYKHKGQIENELWEMGVNVDEYIQ